MLERGGGVAEGERQRRKKRMKSKKRIFRNQTKLTLKLTPDSSEYLKKMAAA